MLTKPAVFLLGLIYDAPVNAYEIVRKLKQMDIKNRLKLSDSTVYTTLKNLEKKAYIIGKTEKMGNMPDRTVYHITEHGKDDFADALRNILLELDYDMTAFSIAIMYIHTFPNGERLKLLVKRLSMLAKQLDELQKRTEEMKGKTISLCDKVEIQRRIGIVNTEISATESLLENGF